MGDYNSSAAYHACLRLHVYVCMYVHDNNNYYALIIVPMFSVLNIRRTWEDQTLEGLDKRLYSASFKH